MPVTFQPPPTYALPIVVDETTGQAQFNPIWLRWFIDLAQVLTNSGAGGGTIQHNSTGGLQGGGTGEYYHLKQANEAVLDGTAASDRIIFFDQSAGNLAQLTVGTNLTITGTTLDAAGVSGLTSGGVLFGGATGLVAQDDTNFHWDDTNNRLGLGTNSPNEQLELTGTIRFSSGTSVLLKSGTTRFLHRTGTNNFGAGDGALAVVSSGSANVAVGVNAGNLISTGGTNVTVGREAASSLTTGSNNTIVGSGSGLSGITTGSKNTLIGALSDFTVSEPTNRIIVGYNTAGDEDNAAVIGDANIVRWKAGGDSTCILGKSDRQFKGLYVTGLAVKETENHAVHKGTTPTLTSGGGGTGSAIAGKDEAFTVTIGTTIGTATFTVTFANAFTNAPAAVAISNTDSATLICATTTTTVIVTKGANFTASSKVHVVVRGYE